MRRHLTAAVAVLAFLPLAGCGNDATEPTAGESSPSDSPTEASTSPSTPEPTEATDTASPSDEATTAAPPVTTLVYYLVDDPRGIRIAREPHELPAEDTAAAAVAAMVAGPADPDYATPWNPDTKVLGVTRQGGVVTVDLSEQARESGAGPDAARRMVQQLVYTVTEVTGAADKVLLTIEGRKPGELWSGVRWTKPVGRADPMVVRNLVQIDTPAEGGTSGRRLTVTGEAATFEATVPWRVVDATGAVVRKGFTTAAEGMTLSPYSFTVRLKPGTYAVEVSEDDASGGEGGVPPRTDTRTVTVAAICALAALVTAVTLRLAPGATTLLLRTDGSHRPTTSASASEDVAERVARLGERYHCSRTGLADGEIPLHAVVLRDGRVRVTSFDEGWAVYQGERPGRLMSVCAR
jgi:hypothetical protein